MELEIINRLKEASLALGLPDPVDARNKLAKNPNGRKWKSRRVKSLLGMVWHQELGWGSIEAVAKYHTSKNSHLAKGGVESISYTFAVSRSGQIYLCNDLNKATWSQGFKGRPGDENAQFLSVLYEGMFRGSSVTDGSAGEPNDLQFLSGLCLWQICKSFWPWGTGDLYGHYHFGKPSCPGNSLGTVIDAVRYNRPVLKLDLSSPLARQKVLIKLGFLQGKADGIWGPISKKALIEFQVKNKLTPDGVWGPQTEKAVQGKLAKP